MGEVAALGIPMCLPIEFGICEGGVYAIQSWIDGTDAEDAMTAMDASAQYRYGLDAGGILRKIHTISAPADAPDWETRFNAKIDRKIAMYEACPLKYDCGSEAFLDYIAENRHLLQGRPQAYQHGDYHIGNMMIHKSGVLTVIDFDRDDFGDPWEEFNRIVWCAQSAPAFASGMVDGYFDGNVPMDFWKLLAAKVSFKNASVFAIISVFMVFSPSDRPVPCWHRILHIIVPLQHLGCLILHDPDFFLPEGNRPG